MRVHAYYALHYGAEWLKWSVRSISNFVDRIHVFYSPVPSFGYMSGELNPETKLDLMSAVDGFGKVVWHDCVHRFSNEGAHRDYAIHKCVEAGADVILVVDADEIWRPDVLQDAIDAVGRNMDHKIFRIGMRHFWRSLKWVCDDPAMPVRFVVPDGWSVEDKYLPGKVFHMGYAQSPQIVGYKWSIHGHLPEMRGRWFEDTFLGWQPGMTDVHPTNANFWNPEPYEDDGYLQNLVGDHPYWNEEVIRDKVHY